MRKGGKKSNQPPITVNKTPQKPLFEQTDQRNVCCIYTLAFLMVKLQTSLQR